jgi:hypothetical protein
MTVRGALRSGVSGALPALAVITSSLCQLTNEETMTPPADPPKMVTQLGSPPKEAMFPCTQRRAAITSMKPWLPGINLSPVLGAGWGQWLAHFSQSLQVCFEPATRMQTVLCSSNLAGCEACLSSI